MIGHPAGRANHRGSVHPIRACLDPTAKACGPEFEHRAYALFEFGRIAGVENSL